ncbi:TonB-dependent receptor [Colwellia sp. E2M01]|uniref:TonB-dependent receptor n=1 Tax=Colwellia sp. E2M01 TaxID=2841561 RepID=UPI001C0984E9|nr:TonB-dependent receptor [Colwellia sp. E2M01]MBU2870061.1 TonB-dependent receptor [Colwellia sp. E2M01]
MNLSLPGYNKHNFRLNKTTRALVGSLALFAAPLAFADSVVEGRVTDANHKVFFQGADIEIKELNVKAVSQRDGSFRFAKLPEGEYTLVIRYLGSENVEQKISVVDGEVLSKDFVIGAHKASKKEMDNVIVYGQRAGKASALNRQKNSNKVVSVISSDGIGQLPDQNAAEALQRMPGIFIERDQGEGRFVGIRGIDPNLNNITINGLNVPSPEAGVRSVAMDVLPSELISSLEVSKTVTPDMDASAIGGSIEVKSLSAFDRSGRSYSLTAQGSYNELKSETSPKLSGSFTDIYSLDDGVQLGVATALSWFKRDFGSDNLESGSGWADFEYEDAATGDDVEVFGTEELEQRAYNIERERMGAALNFDLYTSATDKYYLRTLYSQFSDDEYRLLNQYKYDSGAMDLSTNTATSAQFTDGEVVRETKDRYEEQKIISVIAGGENQLKDWLVEYSLGYSKANEEEPNSIETVFEAEGLDYGYLTSGPVPQLTADAATHDLNNYVLSEAVNAKTLAEDEEVTLALDLTKDFVWQNYNGQFKFGGKYRTREKFNRVNESIYDGGFTDANGEDITAQAFAVGDVEYALGDFGPGMSRSQSTGYILNNLNDFDYNQDESDLESQANSYTSNEDVLALYGMVSFDINDWNIVAGVRYEDTSFSTSGNKVNLTVDETTDTEQVEITPWESSKDYSNFFPSVNVRYNISEQLITRFAYTQTIARPTFENSAAFQIIETEVTEDDGQVETERKAEVGNPELDPYEANNLDFSIEYYPGNIGVLSAGLFYKDIANYVVVQEVQDNGQWDGFEEVLQPQNGGDASLTGLELAWNKTFDSGLLLGANGTFVDADEKLPNQADTVGNIMIGFENDDISIRLSSTYKSENYQFTDNDSDVYQDDHMQIDFSAKYYINNTTQVYFNATNLNDEPYYAYHGDSQYNYQYEEYGRTFELGITITSL